MKQRSGRPRDLEDIDDAEHAQLMGWVNLDASAKIDFFEEMVELAYHSGALSPERLALRDKESFPILEFAHATFLEGRNTTVRRGTRWHGVPAARLRLGDGSLSRPVALETELRVFRDLDEEALRFEHDPGCRTLRGLFSQLAVHYPGFSEDETVTLCHFRL